jgi:hypothetical protein
MTWRIPGPGGHVRHYVALAAIDWLARTAMSADDASAAAQLKRCWLFGFFLRSCDDAARPQSWRALPSSGERRRLDPKRRRE